MTLAEDSTVPRLKFHPNAYKFVFAALRYSQEHLGRSSDEQVVDQSSEIEADESHITGQELLDGVRKLALRQFGLMTQTVFRQWGIRDTGDFGRIVFEMIERGQMTKTDRDQLSDFLDIYEFEEVFDRDYVIETQRAFE
jgi:uncharacterized repeat protein (TIGR04138 family)